MSRIARSAAVLYAAFGFLSLTSSNVAALQQPSASSTPASNISKRAQAVRASRAGAIRFDGKLDESAWTEAQFISGFMQREPNEGAPSTDSTSVAFIYDDDALYVGARLQSRNPDAIRALVTRR